MKITLKKIALTALAVIGYCLGLPLWKKSRGYGRWRVLRYHSVSCARGHETNVTPDNFRRHMRWLKAHYRIADPEDIVGGNMANAVLVTFDDGYADNISEALPILKEEGVRAIVFLIAGVTGTEQLLSHDIGQPQEVNRLLRWDEARSSDRRYIEFGSHGWSHQRLATVEDAGAMRREFMESKTVIEREVGRPVRYFSFPYGVHGDYDERAVAMAREAGYQAAFNAKYGENNAAANPYDFYRIGIEQSDTLFTFHAKLNGALDLLRFAETSWGRRCIRIMNKWVRAA